MDELNRYFVLLNRHFGGFRSAMTRRVGTLEFELVLTGPCRSEIDAIRLLILRIKAYLRRNLGDNNPHTKTLFWRTIPEIREYSYLLFDRVKSGHSVYEGQVRIGIFNG